MKIVSQSPERASSDVVDRPRSRWHVIDEHDVTMLTERHHRLQQLCVRLEHCADCLPARPVVEVVDALVEQLTTGLAADLRQEKEFLVTIFAHGEGARLDRALLRRIEMQFTADLGHAADIAAALGDAGDDLRPPTTEILGYMLRSFFEGCRDTLAFVELAILHLGEHRLTVAASDMLIGALASHPA